MRRADGSPSVADRYVDGEGPGVFSFLSQLVTRPPPSARRPPDPGQTPQTSTISLRAYAHVHMYIFMYMQPSTRSACVPTRGTCT